MSKQYEITEEEKKKVLDTYFKQGIDGRLDIFPSKEKRKLIVLQNILRHFKPNTVYSEKEVNEILKAIYSDFAILRRCFIDYGYMERSRDCTKYWVKQTLL
ncbi:hypothetical protein J32TS6_17310 [Virgibacillus pantothenticus]|uniref:DUF2087 domain-containing protein n=1 Tax=Virgibacillus TaxID=84406 RepID=UPI00067A904E|nr:MULTISPECIES: DUF2087 domain-containing protein [Virgibacillus]API92549.1 hypothetical protein BKP57_12480 [Virgibacillus sp. 6R]MBS7428028.1 DUF2087 domain-containing protein [Virgibacillus sp. 19R1-5]MBU8568563.1 DUF2087 domain-containing protein [Virgibacillus pantothenticus]MBU8602609.1 DUF2087 domain-containing protein [Virgibacillus pantothenticus]MBU8636729.1 DUF2087 domain-containing protein [Virgibacillus pantothenticus]